MRPLPEQIFPIKKCGMMQRQYGGWEITIHCVKRDIVIYYGVNLLDNRVVPRGKPRAKKVIRKMVLR